MPAVIRARDTANQIAKRVEEISAKQETALTAAGADDCSAEERTKHLATFDDLQKEKEAAQADYARWDQLARGQEWSGSPRTAPLATFTGIASVGASGGSGLNGTNAVVSFHIAVTRFLIAE